MLHRLNRLTGSDPIARKIGETFPARHQLPSLAVAIHLHAPPVERQLLLAGRRVQHRHARRDQLAGVDRIQR